MQKVYLLLRNNKQTGPFSLEEVLQFDLKPYDLIWIEGKSAGWYYPQEIQALQPHLSFVKQTLQADIEVKPQATPSEAFELVQPKKVFVSMPAAPIEEAIQKPSSYTSAVHESYKPTAPTHRQSEPQLKTTYAKTLEEVEAEYMNWTLQKKTKRSPALFKKGAIAACLLAGVAFAGWWAVKSFSGSTNNDIRQLAMTPVQAENVSDSVSETNITQAGIKASAKKEERPKVAITKNEKTILKQDLPNKADKEITIKDNTIAANDYETATNKEEDSKVVTQEKTRERVLDAPQVQKKKLGEKILDLFKKKPEEQANEEAKPAENEAGERRSARRETNLAALVTVKFEVPNDWMMGIKGAKAALTNRSNETVVKATVEVQYYNEDNDLLQTKTISFANIGAKKTATVSIPDHSFADHLTYKIISVQGAAEPFARM